MLLSFENCDRQAKAKNEIINTTSHLITLVAATPKGEPTLLHYS